MAADERDVERDFADAVNMTAGEIETWLGTDESRAVGQKEGGGLMNWGHDPLGGG